MATSKKATKKAEPKKKVVKDIEFKNGVLTVNKKDNPNLFALVQSIAEPLPPKEEAMPEMYLLTDTDGNIISNGEVPTEIKSTEEAQSEPEKELSIADILKRNRTK